MENRCLKNPLLISLNCIPFILTLTLFGKHRLFKTSHKIFKYQYYTEHRIPFGNKAHKYWTLSISGNDNKILPFALVNWTKHTNTNKGMCNLIYNFGTFIWFVQEGQQVLRHEIRPLWWSIVTLQILHCDMERSSWKTFYMQQVKFIYYRYYELLNSIYIYI